MSARCGWQSVLSRRPGISRSALPSAVHSGVWIAEIAPALRASTSVSAHVAAPRPAEERPDLATPFPHVLDQVTHIASSVRWASCRAMRWRCRPLRKVIRCPDPPWSAGCEGRSRMSGSGLRHAGPRATRPCARQQMAGIRPLHTAITRMRRGAAYALCNPCLHASSHLAGLSALRPPRISSSMNSLRRRQRPRRKGQARRPPAELDVETLLRHRRCSQLTIGPPLCHRSKVATGVRLRAWPNPNRSE